MTITKEKNGTALKIALKGRLDTATSPELETELSAELDGIEALTFDFTELDYVSSAGLRVLLAAYKRMKKQGTMVITGAKRAIMEIFEVTGLLGILTIE